MPARLRRLFAAPALAALLGSAPPAASPALAQAPPSVHSQAGQIRVQTIARVEHPWGLAFLPDGRFLVTERNAGRLRIGAPDGRLSAPVAGVPEIFRYEGETERSQAGLFDVAIDPGFSQNRIVYLTLSKPSPRGAGTAIVRGQLVESGGQARLENLATVFEMKPEDQDSSGLHFGGRMAIHPTDGTLFLSIGERRNISRSQDTDDQAGSIIRVGRDGQTPRDNPFVGREGHDAAIFATGKRNPQGLAFRPGTDELWAVDHGPKGGDELNLIRAGANYGWPFLTTGVDYSGAPLGSGASREGMVSPVHAFAETVAPSGLTFYQGAMFPGWRGDMLIGGLENQALVRVRLAGQQVAGQEKIEIGRRIRDVKVAPDGAIWLLTEHEDGEILRLTPAAGGRR